MSDEIENIKSEIWDEVPQEDNPFAASVCYCHGYDVFGDLLGKISWSEYLYLLFEGEPPTNIQKSLLENVAVILANPGIRDHSVRAAMNGGVGGSAAASCLMAALAAGSGNLNGSREIYTLINLWNRCEKNIDRWQDYLCEAAETSTGEKKTTVWPGFEHPPGFDPYGISCSKPVIQALDILQDIYPANYLQWLRNNREVLEEISGRPLSMSGVVAAAFADLGLAAEKAELIYLMLRLPGAAIHSLEQKKYGWKQYPYFKNGLKLTNIPHAHK